MSTALIAMHRPIRRQMSRWQHALEEVAVALAPESDASGLGWPTQLHLENADELTCDRPPRREAQTSRIVELAGTTNG